MKEKDPTNTKTLSNFPSGDNHQVATALIRVRFQISSSVQLSSATWILEYGTNICTMYPKLYGSNQTMISSPRLSNEPTLP